MCFNWIAFRAAFFPLSRERLLLKYQFTRGKRLSLFVSHDLTKDAKELSLSLARARASDNSFSAR